MRVMLFGTESTIHTRRYIHLLQVGGCEIVFVEHEGNPHRNEAGVLYRRYPPRFLRLARYDGGKLSSRAHEWLLQRLRTAEAPDICHVQWIDKRVWHCARAGLRGLRPLVATAWGSDLNRMATADVRDESRRIISEALRGLDLLIVDSLDMIETANALAGRDIRTLLLPIGIDTTLFRPDQDDAREAWRRKLGIGANKVAVLSPRALGVNYRQAAIIRAFARLEPQIRRDAVLVIRAYGAYGVDVEKMTQELDELAASLGIADAVRWAGEIAYTELPGLYAAADLAVNLPLLDAFPVTFLECFASGIPVVTNSLPSYRMSEVAPHLIFTDASESGLTSALQSALTKIGEHKRLALAGREVIVRMFDERVTADRLVEAYRSLTDGHRETEYSASKRA